MRVAVIGAGPAGMSAAYCLAKQGVEVHVYEAGPHVGGLAKSIGLWNQRVDLGPHRFFSSDRRVNELWLEVVGRDYRMVDRLTRIYYNNRFFYYPLRPFNALANLGLLQALACLFSYAKERVAPCKQDGSFEAWVVSRFGRRLFEIFFKTYTEKLWGISCRELDADFAAQRIKKLNLYEAVKNALLGGKKTQHKTLVDQFAYPLRGTGEVYERMARYVESNGGQVRLRCPVQRVLLESGRAKTLELEDGQRHDYDHIISSMPLTLLVSRIPEVPQLVKEAADSLKFRNTILVYLRVDAKTLFPDNWLYVHSNDLAMGRLTNWRNWVPELYGEEPATILTLEYWCYDHEPLWSASDGDLIETAKQEIRRTGLVGEAAISDGAVYRIHRSYPVYDRGYKERLARVEHYLDTVPGLHAIGRYGAFKYNNQDHSILMGLLAAANITQNTGHDLWKINTDYEDYQEASVITETGLSAR